jgi:SAM-dependent methyltransferase
LPSFVEAARARGIDARLGDAQRLTFASEFDAVFSNAALHWMHDATGVLDGVYRALRPDGRFVAEMGAQGNVASIATAMIAALEACGVPWETYPWFFPTADAYRALLERAGFVVETIGSFARPTILPTGLRAWLETFADPFFTNAPGVDRGAVYTHAERYLRPSLRLNDGTWIADYVRLRFSARRP